MQTLLKVKRRKSQTEYLSRTKLLEKAGKKKRKPKDGQSAIEVMILEKRKHNQKEKVI